MTTYANLLRAGALVLLAAGAWCMLARGDASPAPAAPPAADPNYFAFVRSLEGTRPDGALSEDSACRPACARTVTRRCGC